MIEDKLTIRARRATFLNSLHTLHASRPAAARRRFVANLVHGLLIIAAAWVMFKMIGGGL